MLVWLQLAANCPRCRAGPNPWPYFGLRVRFPCFSTGLAPGGGVLTARFRASSRLGRLGSAGTTGGRGGRLGTGILDFCGDCSARYMDIVSSLVSPTRGQLKGSDGGGPPMIELKITPGAKEMWANHGIEGMSVREVVDEVFEQPPACRPETFQQGGRRAWWQIQTTVRRVSVTLYGMKGPDGNWLSIEAVLSGGPHNDDTEYSAGV